MDLGGTTRTPTDHSYSDCQKHRIRHFIQLQSSLQHLARSPLLRKLPHESDVRMSWNHSVILEIYGNTSQRFRGASARIATENLETMPMIKRMSESYHSPVITVLLIHLLSLG